MFKTFKQWHDSETNLVGTDLDIEAARQRARDVHKTTPGYQVWIADATSGETVEDVSPR